MKDTASIFEIFGHSFTRRESRLTVMEITPLRSIGKIRFGMSREEVRKLLSDAPEPFKRTEDSVEDVDFFIEHGLQVIYSADGHCCAVEAMSPAEVTLNGHCIFPATFDIAAHFLAQADPQLMEDSSGVLSVRLSISVYAPGHREDSNTRVESVLAAEEGYYA